MIDLPTAQLETVKQILRDHVPHATIWAFGSRITKDAKPWSDLDLALIEETPIKTARLFALKEALQESDLPIQIDPLDWHAISPEFQAIIRQNYEPLQLDPDGSAPRPRHR